MEKVARTNVAAFGKSTYLRIPATLCEVMGLSKGDNMSVYRDGNKIVFERDGE